MEEGGYFTPLLEDQDGQIEGKRAMEIVRCNSIVPDEPGSKGRMEPSKYGHLSAFPLFHKLI